MNSQSSTTLVKPLIAETIMPYQPFSAVIHKNMNPHQQKAISRDDYGALFKDHDKITDPERLEQGRRNAKIWHDLVRVPENVRCRCARTDCRFHGNCTKCIALHRHFDGFPSCCESIHDKIAAAILAYRAEQAEAK